MIEHKQGFGWRLATVIVATAVALATLIGLAWDGGALRFGSPYRLEAVLPTVSSLIPGAEVTMAGVPVGRVTAVRRYGDGALVELAIDDAHVTPVPVDSRLALRETTPIGENSVEIQPGSAAAKLRSGAIVPVTQAGSYVDVDQLMSVLQGSTSERTRQLIEGLGGALAGRGPQLNATLAGVSGSADPLAHVVQLLGNDRRQVGQLVQQLGDIASAAGERGASIVRLAADALTTFRAVSAQDQSLRSTLDELPSTLAQVRVTADTLGSVTNTAAPVLRSLAVALHELKPAFSALEPAAAVGRTVLGELGAAAPKLSVTLHDVRTLAPPTASALPQLRRLLCQIGPTLRYAQPYTGDLTTFISSFGSAVNAYDNIGHIVRLVPIFGENSIAGLPRSVSQAAFTLMHAGLLGSSTALTWDPYPKPGLIGKESASGSQVLGPSQLKAKTGYVYAHVAPSC